MSLLLSLLFSLLLSLLLNLLVSRNNGRSLGPRKRGYLGDVYVIVGNNPTFFRRTALLRVLLTIIVVVFVVVVFGAVFTFRRCRVGRVFCLLRIFCLLHSVCCCCCIGFFLPLLKYEVAPVKVIFKLVLQDEHFGVARQVLVLWFAQKSYRNLESFLLAFDGPGHSKFPYLDFLHWSKIKRNFGDRHHNLVLAS